MSNFTLEPGRSSGADPSLIADMLGNEKLLPNLRDLLGATEEGLFMQITLQQIEKLLDNQFELDFQKLTFTQQTNTNPQIYSGPGCIKYDNDGQFVLKMYHSYKLSTDFSRDFNDISSVNLGILIPNEKFFSVTGLDMKGHHWTANQICMSGESSLIAQGRVIKAKIKQLNCTTTNKPSANSEEKVYLVVPGDFRLPWNNLENNGVGGSLQSLSLNIGGNECKIIKYRKFIRISIHVPLNLNSEEYAGRILDAAYSGST